MVSLGQAKPNKWTGEREAYVVEITRNVDGLVDVLRDEPQGPGVSVCCVKCVQVYVHACCFCTGCACVGTWACVPMYRVSVWAYTCVGACACVYVCASACLCTRTHSRCLCP